MGFNPGAGHNGFTPGAGTGFPGFPQTMLPAPGGQSKNNLARIEASIGSAEGEAPVRKPSKRSHARSISNNPRMQHPTNYSVQSPIGFEYEPDLYDRELEHNLR